MRVAVQLTEVFLVALAVVHQALVLREQQTLVAVVPVDLQVLVVLVVQVL
jgi:hypothetical protein